MTITAPAPSPSPSFGLSRTIRLGIRRIGFELKQYFRAGDQVFFTFLFPTLMYMIFATIFTAAIGSVSGSL